MNKLENIFQYHTELFFKRINAKYNIDINEIKREWLIFNSDPVFFCVYTFTRLPRKGETCGKKIKSGEYCTQHNKAIKPNKAIKATENEETKEKEKEMDKEMDKEKDKEKKVSKKIEKIEKLEVVKMNYKIGKYIHPPTKLAFFSKEHKVVYGKLSLQDTIVPLCDKDINVCKQYMFRYDLDLIKSDFSQNTSK